MIKRLFCFIPLVFGIILVACGYTKTYHTTNPEEYLRMEGHIANEGDDIRSGLFVFPESIEELEDVEYEYFCEQGILDNSYAIVLKAVYPNQKDYDLEAERLSNINCTIKTSQGSVCNEIEYSETHFDYPAYVAVYNTNMSFEYALADEENSCIVYVYLRLCEGADFLPDKYLPTEFKGKSMEQYDVDWKNQNIYYAPDDDGTGYVYYTDVEDGGI